MLNLGEFLKMCDPNMKVAITNENGVGGASYLVWPDWNMTVKEVMEEIGGGGFHVCGVSIVDGMLYIEADENPWDFGSYWEGEWWGCCESQGYEIELNATMHVVEPSEEDAMITAMDMFSSGVWHTKELQIVKKLPIEHVREHWSC